jgi:hypothetical protein
VLRNEPSKKPIMLRAITRPSTLDSVARIMLLAIGAVASGALLVVPIPAWGWAALRAFLQF